MADSKKYDSKKFDSQEDYWEDYLNEKLPPAQEKAAARYQYDNGIKYWLDYYEDQLTFALRKVEMQLKKAKERKNELEFELKFYVWVAAGMLGLLPIALALPMTKVLPLMILGGLLVIALILAFVFVMPVCVYKVIQGYVSKVINDIENSLGEWIVQKYQVPRLTGEIQACQIYVGRYKQHLANIASWNEMLEQGALDIDESEIKNRMETVDLDPDIEVASSSHYRLKKLIKRVTFLTSVVIFSLLFLLLVKGYIGYYNLFKQLWQSM